MESPKKVEYVKKPTQSRIADRINGKMIFKSESLDFTYEIKGKVIVSTAKKKPSHFGLSETKWFLNQFIFIPSDSA